MCHIKFKTGIHEQANYLSSTLSLKAAKRSISFKEEKRNITTSAGVKKVVRSLQEDYKSKGNDLFNQGQLIARAIASGAPRVRDPPRRWWAAAGPPSSSGTRSPESSSWRGSCPAMWGAPGVEATLQANTRDNKASNNKSLEHYDKD